MDGSVKMKQGNVATPRQTVRSDSLCRAGIKSDPLTRGLNMQVNESSARASTPLMQPRQDIHCNTPRNQRMPHANPPGAHAVFQPPERASLRPQSIKLRMPCPSDSAMSQEHDGSVILVQPSNLKSAPSRTSTGPPQSLKRPSCPPKTNSLSAPASSPVASQQHSTANQPELQEGSVQRVLTSQPQLTSRRLAATPRKPTPPLVAKILPTHAAPLGVRDVNTLPPPPHQKTPASQMTPRQMTPNQTTVWPMQSDAPSVKLFEASLRDIYKGLQEPQEASDTVVAI